MGNQYLSVMWNILKIINILMRALYLILSPIDSCKKSSGDKGYESVMEGGDNSNNNAPLTVHVDISVYQVQRMNFNPLKENPRKIKKLYTVQTFSMKEF